LSASLGFAVSIAQPGTAYFAEESAACALPAEVLAAAFAAPEGAAPLCAEIFAELLATDAKRNTTTTRNRPARMEVLHRREKWKSGSRTIIRPQARKINHIV
jgi:hypothetical protein